jgi:multiple sugar transport system permease protein
VISWRLRKALQEVGAKLGMVCILLFVGFPILWIVLTAFKYHRDARSASFFFTPTLQTLRRI